MNKLKAVQITTNDFSLNEWLWTAKSLKEEEDFIVGVDFFHYCLLMQVLDLLGENDQKFEYNFV